MGQAVYDVQRQRRRIALMFGLLTLQLSQLGEHTGELVSEVLALYGHRCFSSEPLPWSRSLWFTRCGLEGFLAILMCLPVKN